MSETENPDATKKSRDRDTSPIRKTKSWLVTYCCNGRPMDEFDPCQTAYTVDDEGEEFGRFTTWEKALESVQLLKDNMWDQDEEGDPNHAIWYNSLRRITVKYDNKQ